MRAGDSGVDRFIDGGRLEVPTGVGEGEADPLLNGLALHREPFGVGALMVTQGTDERLFTGSGYQDKSAYRGPARRQNGEAEEAQNQLQYVQGCMAVGRRGCVSVWGATRRWRGGRSAGACVYTDARATTMTR